MDLAETLVEEDFAGCSPSKVTSTRAFLEYGSALFPITWRAPPDFCLGCLAILTRKMEMIEYFEKRWKNFASKVRSP